VTTASHHLKRWLPWVLSAAIVAFLFLSTDLAAVGDALATADWGALVAWMTLVTAVAFLVDAGTIAALMRRFVTPLGYGEVIAIRGVSYFLNVLNYSLAAGGMAWIVSKKKGVPFLRAFAALMWLFFVDVIALGLLLTIGWLVGRDALGPFIDSVPIVIAVVWAIVLGALVFWNARFDFFVLGFMRPWRIFDTFREARLVDYALMVALRIALVGVYVLTHWLLLPTFDVSIPFVELLMYTPLVTFVQVIPATVSGLGAAQGVMVALFAPYVVHASDPKAVIIAYSTVIGPLATLIRLVIGYAVMATIAREVVPNEADVEAAREAAARETPPA